MTKILLCWTSCAVVLNNKVKLVKLLITCSAESTSETHRHWVNIYVEQDEYNYNEYNYIVQNQKAYCNHGGHCIWLIVIHYEGCTCSLPILSLNPGLINVMQIFLSFFIAFSLFFFFSVLSTFNVHLTDSYNL